MAGDIKVDGMAGKRSGGGKRKATKTKKAKKGGKKR